MTTLKALIALSLGALCAACATNGGMEELPAPRIDPDNVPTQVTLNAPVPVLLATFTATEGGYEVTMARGQGAPTPTIDTDRDVVVRALDTNGEEMAVVSVFNPRDIHTTGSTDPETAVREEGSFTVAFARPEEIRSLEVEVVRGANEGLERTISVDPNELPWRDRYPQQ